jgi:predicted pyridoxine 5'-phosphate oxidase superfamily flavin-nucleotide-binding protein
VPRSDLDRLPEWQAGTVAVLCTVDDSGRPHAIPVSTALRVGGRRVLLALAPGRGSLARLRTDPRAALAILAGDDAAVTVHGPARIVQEPMATTAGIVAVVLEVESIQDHRQPTFTITAGVRWHWTDPEARDRDERVRAALARVAESLD